MFCLVCLNTGVGNGLLSWKLEAGYPVKILHAYIVFPKLYLIIDWLILGIKPRALCYGLSASIRGLTSILSQYHLSV